MLVAYLGLVLRQPLGFPMPFCVHRALFSHHVKHAKDLSRRRHFGGTHARNQLLRTRPLIHSLTTSLTATSHWEIVINGRARTAYFRALARLATAATNWTVRKSNSQLGKTYVQPDCSFPRNVFEVSSISFRDSYTATDNGTERGRRNFRDLGTRSRFYHNKQFVRNFDSRLRLYCLLSQSSFSTD